MDSKRKIVIVSPKEPCGATWLINCFLELGILTYRGSVDNMWHVEGNRYFLKKNENILKKWLPTLSRVEHFFFKDNLEIEWVHDWPTQRYDRYQIIYFFRDPRDALYSDYRRVSPQMSYKDYLDFLDPRTLLDKVETFYFFTKCWLEHSQIGLFKFEEYKKNPNEVLKQILSYVDISVADNDVQKAVKFSTSERAAMSEKQFREKNPEDRQIVNRGGQMGKWKEFLESELDASSRIEGVCGALLQDLGYIQKGDELINMSTYLNHVKALSHFEKIKLPKSSGPVDPEQSKKMMLRVLGFIAALNISKIKSSGLYLGGIICLLQTLSEFLEKQNKNGIEPLRKLHSHYSSDIDFYRQLYKRTGKKKYCYHIIKSLPSRETFIKIKRKIIGYAGVRK